MSLALYYKPSFERLQKQITAIAPDLEVALYEEDGTITYQGKSVDLSKLAPEYFWIHAELFKSKHLLDYFRLMRESSSIKWLHTINTGLDQLPYLPLVEKGVQVTNNHSQSVAIAEYVFGQLLAYYQNVYDFRQKQEDRIWQQRGFREISGSHWVIIGFGHIGQAIAQRAKAFGVHITAVRRRQDKAGLADAVISQAELPEVLPSADVVVLACTSNKDTRQLVDADFLAKMKAKSVLINIARGDLLVESDLKQGLEQGKPEFAILDVFEQEPLAQDAWPWQHPQVSLTPHTSHAGSGMRDRSVETFLENLKRITASESLLNLVSPKDIV